MLSVLARLLTSIETKECEGEKRKNDIFFKKKRKGDNDYVLSGCLIRYDLSPKTFHVVIHV